MIRRRARQTLSTAGCCAALAACLVLPAAALRAQEAATFSPTYAASEGSPYSEVYARTFGTSGRPAPGATAEAPPLVTSAPPPAPTPSAEADVVYVIEGERLLTYRAEDYTGGGGAALDQAPLPPAGTAYIGGTPEVRVPSIADRLYGDPWPLQPAFEAAPLDTAAGPIPLTPPAAPPAD